LKPLLQYFALCLHFCDLGGVVFNGYLHNLYRFLQRCASSQDRIKGGATGAIAPPPPLWEAPPWWNLFVSNKIRVWKI